MNDPVASEPVTHEILRSFTSVAVQERDAQSNRKRFRLVDRTYSLLDKDEKRNMETNLNGEKAKRNIDCDRVRAGDSV